MDLSLAAWSLTWDEADPGRHPFDAAAAPEAVRALDPASAVPVRPAGQPGDRDLYEWARETGSVWAESMTRAIVGHWGRWAAGWRWARDEGDGGGGPVGSWCCAAHSITGAGETLARVSDALIEWRAWLEELAACFERYPLAGVAAADSRARWERGAVDEAVGGRFRSWAEPGEADVRDVAGKLGRTVSDLGQGRPGDG